jgi:lipoprotein-anchoring transpeptidase ErfK/SrfK
LISSGVSPGVGICCATALEAVVKSIDTVPIHSVKVTSERGARMAGGILLANAQERPSVTPRYHVHVTRRATTVPVAAVLAAALTGCGGGTPSTPPPPQRTPKIITASPPPEVPDEPVLGPHESLVAYADSHRIPAFSHPGADEPFAVFRHPDEHGARPVFLVDRARERWVRAYLPMRPNGVEGWIRERDVVFYSNPYRVDVDLGGNRLRVFEDGKVIMKEIVAVGTGGTPTPRGLFYTTILAQFPSASGAYGPFAFGLSAYSEVLFSFAGGDGQVAIHGTNAPALLGQDVSHGCIWMRNPAIRRLANFLPLGTPVRIKP